MHRRSLNVDGEKKGKVRKRGCSSSSSSSLMQNYRLKRALMVAKKGGSTTPVPTWKMMSSESPSMEDDETFKCVAGEKVKELSVSARKLAAILWEINGVPSPRLKRDIVEDRRSEVGRKRVLEPSKLSSIAKHPVSKRTDPAKRGSHRASPGSQELVQPDCDSGGANCLVQVCPVKNRASSDCRHLTGLKNCLRDMYDGLGTSKELLKVLLRCLQCVEQMSTTSLSVILALEFELDRACTCAKKLIQGQMTKGGEIGLLLRQFEGERMVSRTKERDMIQRGLAGELEKQKKLRRETEKLNKQLEKELSQTKASLLRANKELEAEKKAREMVEYVCDELSRGVGEDRAEVEELKRQSARLHEEVEKEREMLQLVDMLREERVQMKLSDAKNVFEEKNAVVDGLRNELEAYLKSKACNEQQRDVFPRYRKIEVLEKYFRETFPGSDHKEGEECKTVNEEDDSDESDLCSIELNMDDIKRSFTWGNAVKNESKRNSVDESKGRKPTSDKTQTTTSSAADKQDNSGDTGVFGFPSGKDIEYQLIKDLRDHIVSGSRTASSQDLSSPNPNLGHPTISPKDAHALECHD